MPMQSRSCSSPSRTAPEWTHGKCPGDVPEAPLPYNEKRLVMNEATGVRERTAACDKPKGKLSFN